MAIMWLTRNIRSFAYVPSYFTSRLLPYRLQAKRNYLNGRQLHVALFRVFKWFSKLHDTTFIYWRRYLFWDIKPKVVKGRLRYRDVRVKGLDWGSINGVDMAKVFQTIRSAQNTLNNFLMELDVLNKESRPINELRIRLSTLLHVAHYMA